ncbi:MAG: hypothetical protein Q4G70_09730 [Pseudomonadota bacterium]|nr:hypothetical protein [Pseudomonadota bacterium]
MPIHRSTLVALATTTLSLACVSALAVKVGPSGPLSLDDFVPKAQRPYAAAEIHGRASHTQRVDEIRIIQAELAYRGRGFTAKQVCEAYQAAIANRIGVDGVVSNRFGCQPYPAENGDDRVRTVLVANYQPPSKLVTQTASAIFTVCKSHQLYDPARHECYDPYVGGADGG